MPRQFDGILPERPVRNAMPDRIQDKLADVLNGLHRPGGDAGDHAPRCPVIPEFDRPNLTKTDLDHSGQLGPVIGQLLEHVRGDDATARNFEIQAADHDARVSDADAGATALHFVPDGEYIRHVDHFNSQSLSMHPDWYML